MKNTKYFLISGILVCLTAPSIAQKITQVYSAELRCNFLEKADSIKKDFSDMLGKAYYVNIGKSARPWMIHEEDDRKVVVTEDGVTFNATKKEKYTLHYSDKQEIIIQEYSYLGKVYEIKLSGLTVYYKIKDLEFAKRFADDLVYFQNMKDLVSVSDIKNFESIAADYRALKIKPPVAEEARKYIVQANAMTELKEYKKAIDFYDKALQIDPANPMVYNNQALLYAIVNRYADAINFMKKYLMLVPDAPDARAVQDKIYEWELSVTK